MSSNLQSSMSLSTTCGKVNLRYNKLIEGKNYLVHLASFVLTLVTGM